MPRHRDTDEEDAPAQPIGLMIGIFFGSFFTTLLLGGLVVWLVSSGRTPTKPGPDVAQNPPVNMNPNPTPPGPNPPGPTPPAPNPPVQPQLTKVFLADLTETKVIEGPWPLGKGKTGSPEPPGTDASIKVKGVAAPKGLGLHPPSNGNACVVYDLGGQAQEVRGAVGLNDAVNVGNPSPITFSIWGDGKELWRSPVVSAQETTHEFNVDVRGVKELELRVRCEKFAIHCHAVWIDPYLLK